MSVHTHAHDAGRFVLDYLLHKSLPTVSEQQSREPSVSAAFDQWSKAIPDLTRVLPASLSTLDDAILLGFEADRLGLSFSAGYQAALHFLEDQTTTKFATTTADSSSPQRRARWLSRAERTARYSQLYSFCASEQGPPIPRNIKTRLEWDGKSGTATLSGRKGFVTGGTKATRYLVIARWDGSNASSLSSPPSKSTSSSTSTSTTTPTSTTPLPSSLPSHPPPSPPPSAKNASGSPTLVGVWVNRDDAGVTATMPQRNRLPFGPEIDHGVVTFNSTPVQAINIISATVPSPAPSLRTISSTSSSVPPSSSTSSVSSGSAASTVPLNGTEALLKPFRTVEDIHVLGAQLGHFVRVLRQVKDTQQQQQRHQQQQQQQQQHHQQIGGNNTFVHSFIEEILSCIVALRSVFYLFSRAWHPLTHVLVDVDVATPQAPATLAASSFPSSSSAPPRAGSRVDPGVHLALQGVFAQATRCLTQVLQHLQQIHPADAHAAGDVTDALEAKGNAVTTSAAASSSSAATTPAIAASADTDAVVVLVGRLSRDFPLLSVAQKARDLRAVAAWEEVDRTTNKEKKGIRSKL